MPNPKNKALYEKAKKLITKTYGTTTSAYRSMAIVKQYKKMGGTYISKPNLKSEKNGLVRWLTEKWIQISPYVKDGTKVKCGSKNRRTHACRPLKRVSKSTPITVQEVIQKHGLKKTKQLVSIKKQNSQKYRVNWVDGRVIK